MSVDKVFWTLNLTTQHQQIRGGLCDEVGGRPILHHDKWQMEITIILLVGQVMVHNVHDGPIHRFHLPVTLRTERTGASLLDHQESTELALELGTIISMNLAGHIPAANELAHQYARCGTGCDVSEAVCLREFGELVAYNHDVSVVTGRLS